MNTFKGLLQLILPTHKGITPVDFFLQHVDATEGELSIEPELISFRITVGIESSILPSILDVSIQGGYWVYTFTTLLDLVEIIRFDEEKKAIAYFKSVDTSEGNLVIEKLLIELERV